jgi:hypothetical protein
LNGPGPTKRCVNGLPSMPLEISAGIDARDTSLEHAYTRYRLARLPCPGCGRILGQYVADPPSHRQPPCRRSTGSLGATQGETASERILTHAQAPHEGTRRLYERLTGCPARKRRTLLANEGLFPDSRDAPTWIVRSLPADHARTRGTVGTTCQGIGFRSCETLLELAVRNLLR